MDTLFKSSGIYKAYKALLNIYNNSLLNSILLTLAEWVSNSKISKIIVSYFGRIPTVRYSLTYKFLAFLFIKGDKCVEKLLSFIRCSLISRFYNFIFREGKSNLKTVILLGILCFMLSYSITVTYLHHWAITKYAFLFVCMVILIFVYKSINVMLWVKNSLTYRIYKFLEE